MPKGSVYRFSLDAHGFVIRAVPGFCELLGLRTTRRCVPRFDSFVSRESGSVFLQSVLNAYRGFGVKRRLIAIISKDGEKKYGYLSLNPSATADDELVVAVEGKFELKF